MQYLQPQRTYTEEKIERREYIYVYRLYYIVPIVFDVVLLANDHHRFSFRLRGNYEASARGGRWLVYSGIGSGVV